MENIAKVFAYRLKEARGGRTQDAMSALLDMPKPTYVTLEQGRTVPTESTRCAISEKLGISESWFFLDPDLTKPTLEQAIQVLSESVGLTVKIEKADKKANLFELLGRMNEDQISSLVGAGTAILDDANADLAIRTNDNGRVVKNIVKRRK